jgi:uncharacterized membrane protein
MRSWLLHARESFWFLPAVCGVAAVSIALGLIELDRFLQDNGLADIRMIADLSATGSRALLATIGGTMLGVAATTFSITISVLATTSSAYGPRLVLNFMADRGNQFVLAVLTSTFLYALVVLRAVRTHEDATITFVPNIAVSFAFVLAVADVAVLVYFIHHIASSVQVTTMQSRVLGELMGVIDLLYPTTAVNQPRNTDAVRLPAGGVARSTSAGYVQHVDVERLVHLATEHNLVIRVVATAGTYMLRGETLAQTHALGTAVAPATLSKSVAHAFTIDTVRTPHQDLRYATQGLIEIGVRGLAAGANDPYTAISGIDALGYALVTLFSRPTPTGLNCDSEGELRVLCTWPSPSDVSADVFLALRTYGLGHPIVVDATIRLVDRLEKVATGNERRALGEQTATLRDAYARVASDEVDGPDRVAALETVLHRF